MRKITIENNYLVGENQDATVRRILNDIENTLTICLERDKEYILILTVDEIDS